MEYVVLCWFTMFAIFIFWHTELYDFRTGWIRAEGKEKEEGKVKMGEGIVNFYQRILGSIALPIP
jgi:hypothetical protein